MNYIIYICILLFVVLVIILFKLYQRIKYDSTLLIKQKSDIQLLTDELEMMSMLASETENAILLIDSNTAVVWVNKAYSKVFQNTIESFPKEFATCFPGIINYQDIEEKYDLSLKEKISTTGEFKILIDGFEEKWIHFTFTPCRINTNIYKIIVVCTEITHLKTVENSLREKNVSWSQSVNTAQVIQQAILPDITNQNSVFNCFVLYKPKDIVSGDFYWYTWIQSLDYHFIILSDCTGHGVPGAFMSLIGNRLLNEILLIELIYEPYLILNKLREKVNTIFNANVLDNYFGMDISICRFKIHTDSVNLTYGGSKSNIWIYSKSENNITKYRGDSFSITGFKKELKNIFTQKEITVNKSDIIYMSTDGYSDQNNENRLRYGITKFEELLALVATENFVDQKEILDNEIEAWMENTEQRDDISIIGVKFS